MKQANAKQSAVDWGQARARLRASEQALAESLAESPERVAAAYRKRAIQMANTQAGEKPPAAVASALIFSLGQERYAVELSELAEILPFGFCASVPGASAPILGVINLRGELRAVVDLRRMLLRVDNGTAAAGFVLMLKRRGKEVGLRVDHVEGLREIPREKVLSPESGKCTKPISGETLLLLDVERVLAEIFPERGY